MKLVGKWGRRAYDRFRDIPIVVGIMQWIYYTISPISNPHLRSYKYKAEQEVPLDRKPYKQEELKNLKIAIICDEMTFRGFETECQCFFITPANWMKVFRKEKPDLFFCESAWSGIEEYPESWRGRIYRSNKVRFDNRNDLLNILDFCHRSHIPTVFWNKEDPTYFEDREHDFVNTALMFDYIYTTAEECVEKYKALGHNHVKTLMFGFSPMLFNPLNRKPDEKKVVFTGSWYADQKQRCKDMSKLFDRIIELGLSLEIYDRHWDSNNPINQFPDKYKRYIHKGVSFSKLNEVLKSACFGVNINTVKDSNTMFARRVFEMMASNLMIISNDSVGMRKLFGTDIWFVDEEFNIEEVEVSCRRNFRKVFIEHTCKQRLIQVAKDIGCLEKISEPMIAIIYHEDKALAKTHFDRIKYPAKKGGIEKEGVIYGLEEKKFKLEDAAFIIEIEDIEQVPDLELMVSQFSYIDSTCCGICERTPRYTYQTDANNGQTLFSIEQYRKIREDKKIITKKYCI